MNDTASMTRAPMDDCSTTTLTIYSAKLTPAQNAICAKLEQVTGQFPEGIVALDVGQLTPKEFWRLNVMKAHDVYSAVLKLQFPEEEKE